MNQRTLAANVKAAVTLALQTGTTPPLTGADMRPVALDYDEAQELEKANTLPPLYVVVSLTRRFGGVSRVTTEKAVSGWRLTATAVGTTVDEARWCAERVASLEYSRIAATDYSLSPLMFETADAPRPDDGLYSAPSTWTFTTTPA